MRCFANSAIKLKEIFENCKTNYIQINNLGKLTLIQVKMKNNIQRALFKKQNTLEKKTKCVRGFYGKNISKNPF